MAILRWFVMYIKNEVFSLPTRIFILVAAIGLAIFPQVFDEPYIFRILIFVNIFVIFAVSWDLLSGFAGQTNFGHALFFGVAAYGSALINLKLGWSPVVSIPLGAVLAVAAGIIGALPALRLKGPFLALASFSLPVILVGVIYIFPSFTGGELGVSGITRLAKTRVQEYYIAFGAMIVLVTIMWKITQSNLGIIFHAIREDEITARASGINTTLYKIVAFGLSGLFAGLAGGLYAHFMRAAGPSNLDMLMSFQPVIWTIFGGTATIFGPVLGVYLLVPLMEVLHIIPEIRMLVFASILILTLRFMPEGLATWIKHKLEKECPRCKSANSFTRKECRICSAGLS